MKIPTIIGLGLICILFFPQVIASPSIIIYEYDLTPEIFFPGDEGILKVTIKNAEPTNTVASTTTYGSTSVVNTVTNGAEINKIWVITSTDSSGNTLKASQYYEDTGYLAPTASFEIVFEIIADNDIAQGLYFPMVGIDLETYTDVQFPIPINVSAKTVELLVTSVPSKISSSGSTDITLTAINTRRSSIDAVTITPEKADGIDCIPSSIYLGTMDALSSEEVTFSIEPSEPGVINLTFTVSFLNGINLHTEVVSIPLEIVESLDVAPIFYDFPTTIEQGESTRIRLEVYNAKTSGITGVIVTPKTDARMSPSEYFIGSMDPDDVFSATFDMDTDDLAIGLHTIDFVVSFKQGENLYQTPNVSSSFEITPMTQASNDNILGLAIGSFIVFIVVVILFFIWRKRRIDK